MNIFLILGGFMFKNLKIIIFTFVAVVLSCTLFAREFRVAELPNGIVHDCTTCHVSQTNSARNAFGKIIQTSYLTIAGANGHVKWSKALAQLDSDGDGFTNGQELGDPNGTWVAGQPDPVSTSTISNPGDKNSKPVISSVVDFLSNNDNPDLNLINIYPNPVSESAIINFKMYKAGSLSIDILNLNGNLVSIVQTATYLNDGDYTYNWSSEDLNGNKLPKGAYLVRFSFNGTSFAKKIIVQ